MEQNNSYSVISIVDLFAYCIKKFWVLFFGAIIGLVLLLSYHVYDANTEKKLEAYDKEVVRYNEKLLAEEQSLGILSDDLQFIDKLYAQNPLFGSGDVYSAKVLFSVDSQKEVRITESGVIVTEIGLRIQKVWDVLDVSSIVGSEIEPDILKTSFFFSSSGLMFEITIYAGTEESANVYANKMLDYFCEFIEGNDGDSLSFKSITVSKASKEDISNRIRKTVSDRTSLLSRIEALEEEIESVQKMKPSKYHFVRYAASGFLLGGILTLLFELISFIAKNPLASSFNSERNLSIPFLGALFISNDFFSRLARRIIGERVFKTDDAELFFKSIVQSNRFCDSNEIKDISVISSVSAKLVGDTGIKISKILNECGYNAVILTDSVNNPETAKAIDNADGVIILERQWKSRTQIVRSSIKNSNDYGKKVLGFFLC